MQRGWLLIIKHNRHPGAEGCDATTVQLIAVAGTKKIANV